MTHWLIIGNTGGIGAACEKILKSRHQTVTGFSRSHLDLNNLSGIQNLDLSGFDVVINCAGHNKGTFKGFLKNDYHNIIDQIQVNFIANILLLKKYATSRERGRYVWLNSTSTGKPTPYQSVYGATKVASKFAIDLVRQEASHINITECCIGLTKTNLRFTGYCGTKNRDAVEHEYTQLNALDPYDVSLKIVDAINDDKDLIIIV